MRVLFIASTKQIENPYRDPATRYRCFNRAEDLRLLGYEADVCLLSKFEAGYVGQFDLFVFHRPRDGAHLDKAIKLIDEAHKQRIADYDDFIFGEESVTSSPLLLNNRASAAHVYDLHLQNQAAMRKFKHVSTSTVPLKDEVLLQHPRARVKVIPNGLSMRWLLKSDKLKLKNDGVKRISYLSGTPSHGKDFEHISEFLAKFLQKHKDVKLQLVGPVSIEEGLFSADQLETHALVDYHELPFFIANSTVTIAPLLDNPFNQCKSCIKFIESAAFGVPVVASPIADIARLRKLGVRMAETHWEWAAQLEQTLFEKTAQERDRLRQNVRANCLSLDATKEVLAWYHQLAGATEPVKLHEAQTITPENEIEVVKSLEHWIAMSASSRAMPHWHGTYKKIKKFGRSPKQFFADSSFWGLRLLSKLF